MYEPMRSPSMHAAHRTLELAFWIHGHSVSVDLIILAFFELGLLVRRNGYGCF
ncbi:hypothetical protein BO70DRAFT_362727 [Aspergillus heteromorphus CBS 117.55]|uniref:Uncharacterized protein n=1 Tax=Aspergillus heteromorphus CBS 117.55 TaxID=1448321 RepID=A0A317W0Z0_9EURO|nr:uncharacterized protein BO70DRAFT_362727 [Aspergillus heteromorphus CBS 117.55]PWY79559.1 hypothetical protein BO70DRAFT_362727 [Aspergillus heteromorphus CBS 117.55]